jgi:hypothetical protein
MIASPAQPTNRSLTSLQNAFLTILPRIESHGRIFFRHIPCPVQKQEAVAEMTALAWKWFIRLAARGKDAVQFPAALASLAARAVKSGRRLDGLEPAADALSSRAQLRHSFKVCQLSDNRRLFEEALCENTVSPVPEQVSFRVDFPAWHGTRCERDQQVIDDLMIGERAQEVGRRHGLTPGRVSQLRQEYYDDWQSFCGEEVKAVASPSAEEKWSERRVRK